jgi:AraC family transcriptional regulator
MCGFTSARSREGAATNQTTPLRSYSLMATRFADVTEDDDGVLVTSAEVNGLILSELRFPAGYVQSAYEPQRPYVAVVLEGGMVKSFRAKTLDFGRESALTMPAGLWHRTRFGSVASTVVIIGPSSESTPPRGGFRRLVELRGRGLNWLAWKLAGELRASDAAAPIAAEGFALEILAAATRETAIDRRVGRPPRWLGSAEELLRARIGDPVGLSELATAVGVNAGHLARVFRAHYGISVGEYGRRLRLDWAASEIASDDRSIAEIATAAGFADQSHFTRRFRRHVGTTPARFREEARRVPR